MDNKKERRETMRIPLLNESVEWRGEDFTELVLMADISSSGVFVKSIKNIASKSPVALTLVLPGDLGKFMLTGSIVWRRWANKKGKTNPLGFAVKFHQLEPHVQKIFDAYLVYIRNKQIINVSKRIIEEFFGSEGPKQIF